MILVGTKIRPGPCNRSQRRGDAARFRFYSEPGKKGQVRGQHEHGPYEDAASDASAQGRRLISSPD